MNDVLGNILKGALALGLGIASLAVMLTGMIALAAGSIWIGLPTFAIGFGMMFAASKLVA